MFETDQNQFFESALFESLGEQHTVLSIHFITGGCINNTLKLETNKGVFFIKWNESHDQESDMFEKEAEGLNLLRSSNAIKVPEVLGKGKIGTKNYLLLEFIPKQAPCKDFWQDFGTSMAHLHQTTHQYYGLCYTNYIGRLPQKNDWQDQWIDFFIENRLEVQLGLAIYNRYIDQDFAKRFRQLYAQLPGLLTNEPPSLLHGDLWSGNFIVGTAGKACILDPAVYYGNREIELAFTQLFGGYDQAFYHSYFEQWPVEPEFQDRAEIYNLYPLLVHVNLFGSSYLSGVDRTLRRFI
jgi:fructosamine-3-kinase